MHHAFPRMCASIKQFVDPCPFCRKMSPRSHALRVQPFTVATYHFAECFDIETVGPLPKDDFRYEYVLVVIDAFTRFLRLHPMRGTSALEAARSTIATISTLACPRIIHSDHGAHFFGELFDHKSANSKTESAIKKLIDTCAR
jgi:transposase InsO family protein